MMRTIWLKSILAACLTCLMAPTIANAGEACSKVKYKPLQGKMELKFKTCVAKGKCVNPARPAASFAPEAYCRAVATATCQKGECENFQSSCYAHADKDNKGLVPKMTGTGNNCNLSVGKKTVVGDECEVEITSAGAGYLGCVCECDQRVAIPKGAEKQGLVISDKKVE
jgi:hypothetical protein